MNSIVPIISFADGGDPLMSCYSTCEIYSIFDKLKKDVKNNCVKLQKFIRMNINYEEPK